jgi:hypothetical protein
VTPSGKTIGVLIALTTSLMLFSIVFWKLGNQTLAATTGTVAVGLVGDICRRLLSDPTDPTVQATASEAAPPSVTSMPTAQAEETTPATQAQIAPESPPSADTAA